MVLVSLKIDPQTIRNIDIKCWVLGAGNCKLSLDFSIIIEGLYFRPKTPLV